MAGDFITVECSDCGNEQTIFQKPASVVNCAVCGTTLATPTGGKARIDHEIVDVVEAR
jgi:small subunit ribosomal protein S27e